MSNYITEAFKQLNLLESEDISLDASGIEELRSFLDDAAVDPDEEMMDIYDLEAEAKEDLQKSYEGKVVLECTVCHSHIFEDKENISMDDDGEACKDIECPYCMSNEGYFILGEIAPFNQEQADSFAEDDDELDEIDIEGAADEVNDEDIIEESLTEEMKLDGVEELYDNDEIRGVEELEGSDKMEGSDAIRGDKHKAPISESYSYELYDDVCREYESLYPYDITLEQVWDEIMSKYDDEALANDVVASLESYDRGDQYYEALDPADRMTDEEKLKRGWVVNGKKRILVKTPDGKAVSKIIDTDEPDSKASDFVDESCNSKKVNESIEDVSVTTEDETMTMTTKEDGGVVIETMPKEEEFEAESDEEMIVPVSDESSEVIDVATDALDSEDEEDFEALKDEMEETEEEPFEEEPFEEEEFDEFDEESFDGLGESYLRRCYENVTGFKTSSIASQGNKLFIEGVIKFDSGNEKKTNFVFESIGDNKFEGYNEQISRGKKTFKLSGSVKDNKLVCESLNYNYRSKNELNESVRVYGTVKRK